MPRPVTSRARRKWHRRVPPVRTPSRPLLFAYGTLMRGYALHDVLARGATFVGLGSVRGRLVDLGRYPGLVAGAGRVHGEIYRLDDPQLLPVLDREEGYNFERRRALVALAGGRRARAWLYRYRGPSERAKPIPDGNYRRVTKPSPGRSPWR
jgi:gamma-glutamylcyclotransferase (GGCT)/AIG2-like uncharacterized protein YtfP